MLHRVFVSLLTGAGVAAVCSAAGATPRPLPFTYTTETLGPGELEIEQIADLTPARAVDSGGNTAWIGSMQFQTEFEYGLTNRLELALYVVYVPTLGAGYGAVPETTETTGIKQRLRYVFADPGVWPIDVGLYGELAEGQTEAEVEGKVLLQRRFDKLRIDSNLWAEYELEYPSSHRAVVLNPTLGATYEITPAVHVGVDGWTRMELPDPSPTVYAGPAVLLNFGKLWWSTGLYARLTDLKEAVQPVDKGASFATDPTSFAYGPIWLRTIVGFEL